MLCSALLSCVCVCVSRLEALDKKVEVVAARIEVIHRAHLSDIESFPKRIDARAAELLDQIKQFKLIEQQNQKTREERENKIAGLSLSSFCVLFLLFLYLSFAFC